MSRTQDELNQRFRGATLGAAVADALALPYAHYSREFLRSHSTPLTARFVPHHSGFYPSGQYASGTQLLLAAMDGILEIGGIDGANIASYFSPLWRDQRLIERDGSMAEPLQRFASGQPWHDCALGPGHAEAAPLAPALAGALWNTDDAEARSRGVEEIVRVTHSDSRVLACAAGVAAAVAHNANTGQLVLGPFLDAVCDAARPYDPLIADELLDFPRVLSMTDHRALLHFETLFPDNLYPPTREGLGPYCVPAFWAALYFFLKNPHDYPKCVGSCICAGGLIGTSSFLGGALVGALLGEECIPEPLASEVVDAAGILERTESLFAARPVGDATTPPEAE